MSAQFPIIDKLGGRDAALEQINRLGGKYNRDQARMWIARRSIPGAAQRLLMRAADDQKIEYDADDFHLKTEAA